MVGDINRKHNLSNRCYLYGIWKSMKGRCNNPKDKSYKKLWCKRYKKFVKIGKMILCLFYNWSHQNGYNEEKTKKRIECFDY